MLVGDVFFVDVVFVSVLVLVLVVFFAVVVDDCEVGLDVEMLGLGTTWDVVDLEDLSSDLVVIGLLEVDILSVSLFDELVLEEEETG